jgi:hypothetical protein
VNRIRPLRRFGVTGLALLALLAAATAFAQFRDFGGRAPMRYPTADTYDGRFNYCRGIYTSGRRDGSGNGWTTDYPDADINFSIRLSELTKTRVSIEADGSPNHFVVRLTDPALYQCPFVMMTDVGELMLDDEEVVSLRRYLNKGGFLWVDDFWGSWAWESWVGEIERVFPSREFPIQELPPEHPIFRTMFQVAKVPQIPSINSWRGLGTGTSELGSDSAVATMRAISDRRGRIMVLMTHNTDISDAWEREAADPRYFYSFSPDGYAVGLNVALYAMSH